jgi:glycosyltransferase involved in cell wall biosynthesis
MTSSSTVFLTVITATHNRPLLLLRLRNSLVAEAATERIQWIVADDGSSEPVAEVLASVPPCTNVETEVVTLANGGKHRALNHVLDRINGTLAVVIDDDDRLAPGAIMALRRLWSENTERNSTIIGIVGNSVAVNRRDKAPLPAVTAASLSELNFKYRVSGDRCYVLRGSLYKSLRFPEIPGERFVAESSIWASLYHRGQMLVCDAPIEIAEYQTDGLSARSRRARAENPVGATTVYSRLFAQAPPTRAAVRILANYYRYAVYAFLAGKRRARLTVTPSVSVAAAGFVLAAALLSVDVITNFSEQRPKAPAER